MKPPTLQERVERIAAIPFPENEKSCRDFLGLRCTIYESVFRAFKEDIRNSFTLYHPDFGLPGILR
jgi:hypothetical protein